MLRAFYFAFATLLATKDKSKGKQSSGQIGITHLPITHPHTHMLTESQTPLFHG
jgi:hypothetical protein